MSTLSVPLPPRLEEEVRHLVRRGVAPNKAAVLRMALEQFIERQTVADVLEAEEDLRVGRVYTGDLRSILQRMK